MDSVECAEHPGPFIFREKASERRVLPKLTIQRSRGGEGEQNPFDRPFHEPDPFAGPAVGAPTLAVDLEILPRQSQRLLGVFHHTPRHGMVEPEGAQLITIQPVRSSLGLQNIRSPYPAVCSYCHKGDVSSIAHIDDMLA